MSEYVFRYAPGYGCDMGALMDGGRVTVGEYFAQESTDHYGTLHEEIVRCRDCKHAVAGEAVISGNWQIGSCQNPRFRGSLHAANVKFDGFCAWGERGES